ncbi:hypothetical protein PRIPAC_93772 [Pristionchus pacificus]|uniref:Uncharacterized protein n=1 Tax=Pristionchus pacificus TaxID=54126 RepID=A0A2A6CDZ4_PRIPA|nr:hypothetical protein PRIPAC_93772 [Pristionchus pacificus]|eukprot:PDM76308.1 hypothetical protein PRIPAC_39912 [Pristionchus pacificus]
MSNKGNRRSRSRNRFNIQTVEDVQILVEGFNSVTISGTDIPNPPLTFDSAFASFRALHDNETSRRKRKKRRYLFWNSGSIHSSQTNRNGMPLLKEEFKELVENIRLDGILLNELRLKADSVQNFQNKFKNQISDLGYAIMSFEKSYLSESHWIRGSAILIHKSSGGQQCQPTKIDYVIKGIHEKTISVKVHKPLLPDSYLSDAHYPIIFDVFRNGGNPPAKSYCDDRNCEFACGRRRGGMRGSNRNFLIVNDVIPHRDIGYLT